MWNYARLVIFWGRPRKELIFRARLVEAEEARMLGLVNEVVAAGRLYEYVRKVAIEMPTTRLSLCG